MYTADRENSIFGLDTSRCSRTSTEAQPDKSRVATRGTVVFIAGVSLDQTVARSTELRKRVLQFVFGPRSSYDFADVFKSWL